VTDRKGTASPYSGTAGTPAPAEWSVEGWTVSEDGLSDTVVRMPKITDADAEPRLPAPPKAQDVFVEPPGDAAPSLPSPPTVAAPAAAPMAAATASVVPPVAAPVAAPKPRKSGLRRTRKARLRLSRVDPWSVMKTSFMFSIAFGIMFWVATWLLWTVVVQSGLFEAINAAILNIIQNPSNTTSWRIEDYVNTNKVLGIAALLAVINVVISTALGTLFAFLYNLSANVLGGLELTLAED